MVKDSLSFCKTMLGKVTARVVWISKEEHSSTLLDLCRSWQSLETIRLPWCLISILLSKLRKIKKLWDRHSLVRQLVELKIQIVLIAIYVHLPKVGSRKDTSTTCTIRCVSLSNSRLIQIPLLAWLLQSSPQVKRIITPSNALASLI